MVAVDKVQGERDARYRRAGQLIAPKLMTIRKYVLGVIGLQ
jgi:hypothetical protein